MNHSVAVDERVLKRLAVGPVLQGDVAPGHPLQTAGPGVGPRDARVAAQLELVDSLFIGGQVGDAGVGFDELTLAPTFEAAFEPHVFLAPGKCRRARRHLRRCAAVPIGRHVDDGPIENREDVAVLVVGHADAGARHPVVGKLDGARRANEALAVAVGRVLGLRREAVAGHERHVAVQRHDRVVLTDLPFLPRHRERPSSAALVGGDFHTQELGGPVGVGQLAVVLDADVFVFALEAHDAAARALDNRLQIGARDRRREADSRPGPELERDHDSKRDRKDGNDEARPAISLGHDVEQNIADCKLQIADLLLK